jgi:hypothetical protein
MLKRNMRTELFYTKKQTKAHNAFEPLWRILILTRTSTYLKITKYLNFIQNENRITYNIHMLFQYYF